MSTLYVFDCPVHGYEEQVLCFRAFDKNLQDRWKKYTVEFKIQYISESEISETTRNILLKSDPH